MPKSRCPFCRKAADDLPTHYGGNDCPSLVGAMGWLDKNGKTITREQLPTAFDEHGNKLCSQCRKEPRVWGRYCKPCFYTQPSQIKKRVKSKVSKLYAFAE